MPKISVIGAISMTDEQCVRLKSLAAVSIEADNVRSPSDVEEIVRRIGNADVVLTNVYTPITGETMQRCSRIRFIQTWSTGTDHIDLDQARSLGIRVSNVSGYCTDAVAERTMGAMLLIAGRLQEANASARNGGWDYRAFVGMQLRGKKLLTIGRGRIAGRVMELARAFGMETSGTGSETSSRELKDRVSKAHFISIHCPLTERTHHLIGECEFSSMKGAVLINYARGGIVDECAMLQAIENGNVRYAALDVCEGEPPAKENPLLHHPRVFMTPHCAWNTEESSWQLTEGSIKKIEAFLQGTLSDFIA
jgi:phosphoglycerate dehydrogenase-like enzyme